MSTSNRIRREARSSLNLRVLIDERETLLRELEASDTLQGHINWLKNPGFRDSFLGCIRQDIDRESFGPMVWQELAMLKHQDQRTFNHSLGVAALIRRMLIDDGATKPYLEGSMKKNRISRGMILAAALLHDIGKFAIREIVHDPRTRKDWAKLVNQITGKQIFNPVYLAEDISEAAFDRYIHECGTDPIDQIPIEHCFDKSVIEALERRGIPESITFRKAIELHEEGTRILVGRYSEMEAIAEIAGHHHSCSGPIENLSLPTETSALRIAVTQCLHIADIHQALVSGFRSYKGKFHSLVALAIIIRDAESHALDPGLVRAFVEDQLKLIAHDEPAANDPDISAARKTVEEFVAEAA